MSTPPAFVVLGRLTLPLAAVELALDLERRGLHLRHEDGDVLFVGPRERLTDEDRAGLRRWKLHLLAILDYDTDHPERVQ
jgi:hypothetical protein